eukprot:scaffold96169_cov31-Tisochrysis_lutea.AAC.1
MAVASSAVISAFGSAKRSAAQSVAAHTRRGAPAERNASHPYTPPDTQKKPITVNESTPILRRSGGEKAIAAASWPFTSPPRSTAFSPHSALRPLAPSRSLAHPYTPRLSLPRSLSPPGSPSLPVSPCLPPPSFSFPPSLRFPHPICPYLSPLSTSLCASLSLAPGLPRSFPPSVPLCKFPTASFSP